MKPDTDTTLYPVEVIPVSNKSQVLGRSSVSRGKVLNVFNSFTVPHKSVKLMTRTIVARAFCAEVKWGGNKKTTMTWSQVAVIVSQVLADEWTYPDVHPLSVAVLGKYYADWAISRVCSLTGIKSTLANIPLYKFCGSGESTKGVRKLRQNRVIHIEESAELDALAMCDYVKFSPQVYGGISPEEAFALGINSPHRAWEPPVFSPACHGNEPEASSAVEERGMRVIDAGRYKGEELRSVRGSITISREQRQEGNRPLAVSNIIKRTSRLKI